MKKNIISPEEAARLAKQPDVSAPQKVAAAALEQKNEQKSKNPAGIDEESEDDSDERVEKEDDSAEQLENAEQKDVPPEATTRIDDAQVDEIMDGVKEELKSDIHEQVYNQVKEMLGKELAGELKKQISFLICRIG